MTAGLYNEFLTGFIYLLSSRLQQLPPGSTEAASATQENSADQKQLVFKGQLFLHKVERVTVGYNRTRMKDRFMFTSCIV